MNSSQHVEARLNRGIRAMPLEAEARAAQWRARDLIQITSGHWPGMLVIVLLCAAAAVAYAVFARPVYEANLVVHVEDPADPLRTILGNAPNGNVEVKNAAGAEIELLRSRRVLSPAVDNARLVVTAEPRYVPVVGRWLAQRASGLSEPGFWMRNGWVTGTERIRVASFDVPPALQEEEFDLTADGVEQYTLRHARLSEPLRGTVGKVLSAQVGGGPLSLLVEGLDAGRGARFTLVRHAHAETINRLQRDLKIVERGRTSGVIEASLRDTDPARLVTLLNDIGAIYLQQNSRRKAADADGSLQFVRAQLPVLKQQAEQAEAAFTRYRQRTGRVSVQDESRLLMAHSTELRANLQTARQQRREMSTKFAGNHPDMVALEAQIASWEGQVREVDGQLRQLPGVQQDIAKLEKDVRVSDDMYQQMRARAMQLQMMSDGRIGSVSLVDQALVPTVPVSPKPLLVVGIGVVGGAICAVLFALLRASLHRRAWTAYDIETTTGLNVFGAIPRGTSALRLPAPGRGKDRLPPPRATNDPALVALGNLATILQFGKRAAGPQRLLISGATIGSGRTFVATNLASILAAAGYQVLLIDADLKHGHVAQALGVPRAPGFAELLAGAVQDEEVLQGSHEPLLTVLPAGVLVDAPPTLRLMSRAAEVIERLSARHDIVIIAGPPVLQAAETLLLAEAASDIVLVARPGATQMEEVAESARRLAQWGHDVSGVVVNGLDTSVGQGGPLGRIYGNLAYAAAR